MGAIMKDEERIQLFIQEEIASESIDEGFSWSDNLIESGLIDSLGITKLISYIEQTFSITIKEEDIDIDNFITIDAITKFIKSKSVESIL
jgi:acyl carrier protein